MQDLAGKTAVVTGAGSGMGRAFAERFAAAGMNVVVADVELAALEDVTAELIGRGSTVLAVPTDVSDVAAVEHLRDVTLDRFGRVHLVCNNAGVGGAMPGTGIDLAEWRWVMGVNLWGVIHGHHVFLPHLLEHGDGHIVNTASMAGHVPNHSAYAASKWAVVSLTEGLYQSLRAQGSTVGVSCVCPGWVDTRFASSDRNRPDGTRPPTSDPAGAEREAAIRAHVEEQLRRGTSPADVAEMVHDAVVADRFWVFTDMEWVARLAPRFQAVLDATDPPAPGATVRQD